MKGECWMVETPRFGPFKNEAEAKAFAAKSPNYFAYDVNDHKPGFRRHL